MSAAILEASQQKIKKVAVEDSAVITKGFTIHILEFNCHLGEILWKVFHPGVQ